MELYSDHVLKGVVELCSNVDLVGISLMTNLFDRAAQLTSHLKEQIDIPIVWGGIHPTIRPKECLQHADIVVLGEGEGAMLELTQRIANREPYEDVENLCLKTQDGMRQNPVRPLIQDLDSIPPPDYDNSEYYVYDPEHSRFAVPDLKMLVRLHGKGALYAKGDLNYGTITTRGCPFNCAYCGNSALIKLYGRKGYMRRRSVAHIIAELEAAKMQYGFINQIGFFDDSFLAGTTEEIRDFAEQYKKRIDLPLFCLSTPKNITPQKLKLLVDAGLTGLQVGIQTGSDRINTIYNRGIRNADVLEAAALINSHAGRLHPIYDVIVDNPYETTADRIDTVKLLMHLKKPFTIQVFSLTMFPGTELHERASQDGMIKDEAKQIYGKFYMEREGRYATLLIALVNRGAPTSLMRLLTAKWVVKLLSCSWLGPIYKSLYILNEKLSLAKDKITARIG